MEIKTMKLWDINVPAEIIQSKPKKYKVMGMEAYYKKYKQFYGYVTVDKKGKLLDGYVVYYTAKKNKIFDVPVKVLNTREKVGFFFRKAGR